MKRRGADENSPIKRFVGRVYKCLAIRNSELIARLTGVRNENYGIVVFEKGVVRETVI